MRGGIYFRPTSKYRTPSRTAMSSCTSPACVRIGSAPCRFETSRKCLTMSSSYFVAFMAISCLDSASLTVPCIDMAASMQYLQANANLYTTSSGVTLSSIATDAPYAAGPTDQTLAGALLFNPNVFSVQLDLANTNVFAAPESVDSMQVQLQPPPSSPPPPSPTGACTGKDVNGDGSFSNADVQATTTYLYTGALPVCGYLAMDANKDGVVSFADVVSMLG